MKRLQVVNLYRTQITNAGVARLQELKELTDVDLRYSRVTANGVEALRSALPNCKVQYVGASTIRPKTAGAARPAADTEPAIAAWVKALGGATESDGGRLKGIDLSYTSVSDAQLSHLSGLTGLERLSLEVTQVGDLGMAALQGLTGLKSLNLNSTTVSDAGLAKLAAMTQLAKPDAR